MGKGGVGRQRGLVLKLLVLFQACHAGQGGVLLAASSDQLVRFFSLHRPEPKPSSSGEEQGLATKQEEVVPKKEPKLEPTAAAPQQGSSAMDQAQDQQQ